MDFSIYGASKAALRLLVQPLGLALIEHGSRISAISPGPIPMPIFGCFGLPSEVAQAIKEGNRGQVAEQTLRYAWRDRQGCVVSRG